MLNFLKSPTSGAHLPVLLALGVVATALVAKPEIETRAKEMAAERIARATMATIDGTSIVFLQAGGEEVTGRRRAH